ncbi:MAG: hypothetical protein Q9195_007036 [Heterodermia aff. obscurata]
MSLPPERIMLKRRRGEDAVDCLYLQETRDKRIRSDFHWARIDDNVPNPVGVASSGFSNSTKDSSSPEPGIEPHVARVPAIQSTLPEDEVLKHHNEGHESISAVNARSQTSLVIDKVVVHSPIQRPILPSKARQFHLVKGACASSSHVSTDSRVGKSRKKDKIAVALFTERHAARALQLLDQDQSSKSSTVDVHGLEGFPPQCVNSISPETRTYKKPSATLEEVKWRAKNWKKQARIDENINTIAEIAQRNINIPKSYGDYSLELAMQLQEFALQETQATPSQAPAKQPKARLKFQPKPARARSERIEVPVEENCDIKSMLFSDAPESDECFVYDTFVRSKGLNQMDFSDEGLTPSQVAQRPRSREVGFLIIQEEDEEEWQEYAEEIESEREWDTDDEDENAEDYYGNDYPEDEIDSDDEYNRDAYKYRKYASDDEEYDVESGSHSDGGHSEKLS